MELIGQQHILNAYKIYTILNLPKTTMILGEYGSEQFELIENISSYFELPCVRISDKITTDDLISYAQDPIKKLYVIDLAEFTEKQQNQFLKFIEEPGENVYIILLAESTIGILPTILNRCIKFYCAPYTETQLKQCEWLVRNPNELVYKVCKTPGQLLDVDGNMILELFKLSKKIVKQVRSASYANTLTIINKVKLNNEADKFEINHFLSAIELSAFEEYMNSNDIIAFKIYQYTNKAKQKILNRSFRKESFMLNFLDGLWRTTR